MLAEERWQAIINLLYRQNVVSVLDLSKRLSTSEVTIRRDLRELEEAGKLKRTHGGAIRMDHGGASFEPHLSQLESQNTDLKRMIARKAYDFIEDNSAIIIDSSSTSALLCEFIKQMPKVSLVVVTNSVQVVTSLSSCEHVEVIQIGGQVRKNLLSCTGMLAEMMLAQLKADKLFLGINGIDFRDNVLTTPNIAESSVKRAMMKSARGTIVLADHTKFNRTYLSCVCAANDVDMIITDDQVEPQFIKEAEECGVEIVVASTDGVSDS